MFSKLLFLTYIQGLNILSDSQKERKNHSLNLSHQSEEGFSILEVLVTILVITGFILGSLQATVLATFMRVQAQDKQEATNWVQQDLELIRYNAFILDNPNPLASPLIDPATPLTKTEACSNARYGNRLRASVIGQYPTSSSSSVNINGRPYNVFRVYSPADNSTYSNILQINYTVAYASSHPRYKSSASYTGIPNTNNANVVTSLSTEVLPNAALSCP